MVRSMTGYGRGEAAEETLTVSVELRAVNNRYLDCSVKMPRSCLFAEDAMKELVASKVARGKVDVFVNMTRVGGDDLAVTVNEPVARAYMEALSKLYEMSGGETAKGKEKYPLTALAGFPDVLTVEKREEDREGVKALLLGALESALSDFNAMREREGARLAEDILGKAERIEALTGKVEERSPGIVADYRARLEAKMAEILKDRKIDESRILTEAAIFADKVAVDEETVRLRSHLEQLRGLLEQGGAVGRKLDFLLQEFNREANTIGSKCSDVETTRYVVELKAEIEKVREQIQNLE